MTPTALPLVLVWNERAVCHAVDSAAPVHTLRDVFELYFAQEDLPSGALAWRQGTTLHGLNPDQAIGLQVPADAEIGFLPSVSAGVPSQDPPALSSTAVA